MVQLENESAFDFMSRCFDTQEKETFESGFYVCEGLLKKLAKFEGIDITDERIEEIKKSDSKYAGIYAKQRIYLQF
jgi:hypothetical protein